VRDLLHDQVTRPDAPELANRWNELIDREDQHRRDRSPLPALPLHAAAALG
jgi:hypothetical protein